jgi:DNA-binding MarR family transcriptional regulator
MPENGHLDQTVKLLDNVGGNESANQRSLAREIGISIGLVNALVNRAVRKGLIKIKQAPARRYAYYLTPKGLSEKSRLVAEYLDYSLTFFRTARQEYAELFARCAATGHKRIVLCGAGELAEIATLGVNGSGVELIGVFDRETNQTQIANLPVIRNTGDIPVDAILVITGGKNSQEIYDALLNSGYGQRVFYPKFLRISPQPEKVAAQAS